MTYQSKTIAEDADTLPRLPSWVTSARPETPEDVSFLSGAALAHLQLVLSREEVPQALLRERLALRAAEACVTLSGRSERARELRDAVAFLQPGDQPGPAGEIYLTWKRAVERPISIRALQRAVPALAAEQIATWLDAGQGAPILRAASALQAGLQNNPREHTAALLLADAALAQALGWAHVVPVLGLGLTRADLRKAGADLHFACHRTVVPAATEVTREAANLARRTARLREVAPKLRAKGSEEAVALFLSRDAVAPTALTSLRSDRAARRFCDRLVELGAVHEMTGRDTFRLYGV